jgi:DNA polymerase-1
MSDVREFVREYIARGWSPIPCQPRSKARKAGAVNGTRVTLDQVDALFAPDDNVGILFDDGLVDLDLDAPEAVVAAELLAPATATFGRRSKRRGHYLYQVDGDVERAKFAIPGRRGYAVELKSVGDASIAPGSIHEETGEPIEWADDVEPTRLSADQVHRLASRVAAAALLASEWDSGGRHDRALSLAGTLLRAGWSREEVETFVLAVCRAAGDDETDDRLQAVRDTARRAQEGAETAGWPTLVEGIDEKVAAALRAALELGATVSPDLLRAVAELAGLPPLEYDRRREKTAKELGVRVATLDQAVAEKRRESAGETVGNGTALTFEDPAPHPEPVAGDALLAELVGYFAKYLILPHRGADLLAIWVVHSYAFDLGRVTPILDVHSPEKRCGKSRTLSLLARAVRRALPASNITPSAIFRSVETAQPTLLIDEADSFLKDNEELRGILNSGHSRELAFVVRTVGDDHEPRKFSTWSPKVIALIGTLPATLADRSITLPLRRKTKDETVARLPRDLRTDALVARVVRWVADNADALRRAEPAIPAFLHDRAGDNWEPLLAIADTVGGPWPERAREAALVFSGGSDDATETLAIKLLADIRAVFVAKAVDALHSADLVDALVALDDRPWSELNRGKPMTTVRLASLLRPFGVKAKQLKLDGVNLNGYQLALFEDAFARYLPTDPPETGFRDSTSLQPNGDGASRDFRASTAESSVESPNSPESPPHKESRGVEDQNGVSGDPEGNERSTPVYALLATLGIGVDLVVEAERATAIVAGLSDAKLPIGLDIETARLPAYADDLRAGLCPHRARIRLVQVWDGGPTAYAFDLDKVPLAALAGLWTKKLVAFNATFELKFLLAAGVEPTALGCAKLAGQAIHGRLLSLKDTAAELDPDWTLDKREQVSDWSVPTLSIDQVEYAGLDAIMARLVFERYATALGKKKVGAVYRRLRDAQVAIARLELNGIGFDLDGYRALVARWTAERDEAKTALAEALGPDVNPRSTKQVGEWLAARLDPESLAAWPRTAKGKLSTDSDALAGCDLPVVAPLKRFKVAEKRLSAFGNYDAHVNPETGRIHASYLLGGARTGRMSCRDPNLQQVPNGELRGLFVARPGYQLIDADFSQIELRVVALLAKDSAMLDCYRRGDDLHRRTAAGLLGIEPSAVSKEQRQLAKAANFGLIYGQQAAGFADYARANYGIELSVDEAARIREKFFATYPRLADWQRRTIRDSRKSQSVTTRGGRVRDFSTEPHGYRPTEALNTPVSGAAAEAMLEALARLGPALAGLDARLVNIVHDELLVEVADADVEKAKPAIEGAMRDGFLALFPEAADQVDGLVEAKVGHSWREAK